MVSEAKHKSGNTGALAAASDLRKLPLEEAQSRLGFSSSGLSQSEAEKRISRYGYNELPEEKVNPLPKFLSYFWGPIPAMIMLAAALSAVLGRWPDLGVILALLAMNAVVGFREEYSALNAIAALKQKLAVQARVKRDGNWRIVPARELVPGDLVRLRIGEITPADCRLLGDSAVQIDESALTGESLPVEKGKGATAYSGSIVRQGETEALVYATGKDTYYGKTAQLVESAVTHSHLQQAVLKIADYLIVIAAILAIIIISVSVSRGDSFVVVLQFALVLAIAAVPVAMPAVMSVTMALGARVLAQKQAIVTRLPSIEELAGIDTLCSDKTGTLTQDKLTAGDPFTLNKATPEQVILNAALASRAEDNDPIDLAILNVIKDKQELQLYNVTYFQPFDPVNKRTEATVRDRRGHEFRVTKGAPQVILALDPHASELRSQADKAVNDFASRGFRSLGVARTNESGEWQIIGIIPLYDPLREDSKDTIDFARKMGINVKMVTGDQIAIAREIARQLDLGRNILDASIFEGTRQHEAGQLADAIEKADGFAQVFPEHKYHIVESLQKRGHIVGMTGDGVNDAPALKKADVGIAVSGATDAARAAASIVLLVPGLSAIIDAVKESRKIFQRMTNYSIYRITETVALLIFLTLAILLANFFPVTAIMIVLLAILNDGAILSIAYDNVQYAGKPQAWDMRLVIGIATIMGIFAVLRSFGVFYLGETVFQLDRDVVQTMVYLSLSVGGHLTLFAARTKGPFWSISPSRVLLGAVIGTQIIATLFAVYGFLMTPLGWVLAGVVWAYDIVTFLIQDIIKRGAYRILQQPHSGLLIRRNEK